MALWFLAAFLLVIPAKASDVFAIQSDALDLDAIEQSLPEEARASLGGLEVSRGLSLDKGLESLFREASGQVGGLFRNALASISVLIGIVLLCGVAQLVYTPLAGSSGSNWIPLVGALAISASVSGDIHSLFGLGTEMMQSLDTFSKGMLAALAAATSALGAPATSAARYMATVFFSDILLSVISRLLMPLLYGYIAVTTANAALGEDSLGKLGSFIKWLTAGILTLVVTAFTVYLTVTGTLSGAVDAAAVKATKLLMTNAIPVVGKMLSDATETVLASAGILRNSIGVFGMLGVLGICLIPFLRLGIHYLLFKIAGAVTGPLADKRLSGLIDQLAGAFGLMMGMVGACAVLMLISMVSALQAIR